MSESESRRPEDSHSIDSKISPWLTPLTYFLVGRIAIPLYFKSIEVEGQERLPREGGMILAPTHRSRWDPILLGYLAGRRVTGRDLRFMTLLEQTRGIQGWFVRHLGGFPLDRDRPGTASIRYSVDLLENGEMLVLFPEGHIFQDNEIHPIQPGVARIALQAIAKKPELKLSIVPIALRYDHQPPISWGSRVRIKVGDPISVGSEDLSAKKEATRRITSTLKEALKRLYDGASYSGSE